jgi:hypothetical protein
VAILICPLQTSPIGTPYDFRPRFPISVQHMFRVYRMLFTSRAFCPWSVMGDYGSSASRGRIRPEVTSRVVSASVSANRSSDLACRFVRKWKG